MDVTQRSLDGDSDHHDANGHRGTATMTRDLTAELDLASAPAPVDLHDDPARRAAERALTDIPGVLAARLVPGYERAVDELHVVTDLDRTPKRTVRDVQTLLMARFGVTTDHRVVSVVQLDERTPLASARRVAVRGVGLTGTGMQVEATVTLRSDDEELEGRAVGAGSIAGRQRAVAAATLAAVQPLLDGGSVVELTGVELAEVGGVTVALATVEVTTPRGTAPLVGSAVVRDADADAIVRALLDALNRTLRGV